MIKENIIQKYKKTKMIWWHLKLLYLVVSSVSTDSSSSSSAFDFLVKGFLQFNPAPHLQNTVHPIDLHLQLPRHSLVSHPQWIISLTSSGASLVPGGTELGTRMDPDAVLRDSYPHVFGLMLGGTPVMAVLQWAICLFDILSGWLICRRDITKLHWSWGNFLPPYFNPGFCHCWTRCCIALAIASNEELWSCL